MRNQFLQCLHEPVGCFADRFAPVYLLAIAPGHPQTAAANVSVYFQQVLAWSIAAASGSTGLWRYAPTGSFIYSLSELAQVVEAHLGCRTLSQLPAHLYFATQVPQQPVAQSAPRHSSQTLFHFL